MREERGRKFLMVIAFAFLLVLRSNAQQITVKGGFVEDSLLIGRNVNYWITASYPAFMEIVFPDSNYNFTPFEYAYKTYFPTLLRDKLAFDSTVYTLQSFEIDRVQYLSLDAIVLEGADSTIIATPWDSIFLIELAPVVTDSTKLKENLSYQEVERQFNYPLLYYVLGGVLILVVVLFLIFRKRIIRYFQLRRVQRDYRNFSEVFTEYVRKLKTDPQPELAEQALSIWKKYQQHLDKIRFTVLTTKEIVALAFAKEVEEPLKSIDRAIYGKRIHENIYQDFQQIEDFADDRFQKKIEEIKHG